MCHCFQDERMELRVFLSCFGLYIKLERTKSLTSAECLQDSSHSAYKQGASPAAAKVHSKGSLAGRSLLGRGSRSRTTAWSLSWWILVREQSTNLCPLPRCLGKVWRGCLALLRYEIMLIFGVLVGSGNH